MTPNEALIDRDRQDLVTRQVLDESRLIRFVPAPDGSVAPDLARKLPGRGLWVAADRASIETAVKKNLFARSAKAPLKPAPDLADLATDEIRGGYEVRNGERVKVPGVLESFNLSQEDAELLILQARVAAGWIDASELPQVEEPEYEEEIFAEAGEEGAEYEAEAVDVDAEVFDEDLEPSQDA